MTQLSSFSLFRFVSGGRVFFTHRMVPKPTWEGILRVRRPLALLILGLLSGSGRGQPSQDPLLGNYIIGNSAEMVLLRVPNSQNSLINTLYDCRPGFDSISHFSVDNFAEISSFDVAMGDVDADGKEEAGAIWRGADGSLVLSITRFTPKSVGLAQRAVTSLPGALVRSGGGVRIVRGSFNADPGDEFCIAYWSADQSIRLMILDVDSTTLAPVIRGEIADIVLPSTLADDARFDVAVGDFDRDGLDEVFLTKVNARQTSPSSGGYGDVNCVSHLYACVYDYDPSLSQLTRHGSLSFDVSRAVGCPGFLTTVADVRTGGLAASAGDYNNDGREEPLVCWSAGLVATTITLPVRTWTYPYGELMASPLQVSESLDSLWLVTNGLVSCDRYAPTDAENATGWGVWPVSAASADLNGDGSDELVTGGLRNICVYRPDSLGRFTLFAARALPSLGGLTVASRSHRLLAIADVDASENEASWTPEIVVTNSGLTLYSSYGMAWEVLGVDVDPVFHQLQTLYKKAGGHLFTGFGIFNDTGSLAWAIALGDVNGDAIRVRNPRKIVQTSVLQPLVELNALPIHFDNIGGTCYDVCKNYLQNPGKFSATYELQSGQTVQFSTQVKADWGVSSTLSAGGSFLGIGAKAHFTAKYGEGFSKKQESSRSVTVTESHTTGDDDFICATVTDYEFWEYPLFRDGESRGNVVVVVPRLQTPPTKWISGKGWDAMWRTPRHEVGNILSYIPGGQVPLEYDVDTLLHLFTPSEVSQKAGVNWDIKFDEFMSASQEASRNIGFEAGASVSGWGFEASLEGHYNRDELSTHTSTAANGVRVTLHVEDLDKSLGEVEYTITPCVYWARNGAMVIDYAVAPATSSGGGLETWWEKYYGHLPDPALNLPWRLDPEKGYTLTNPAKRWLSKSVRVSPAVLKPGEQASIKTRIYNFSLVPLTRQVTVRLFTGDPDSGGVPIVGAGGATELRTIGTIQARGYQNLEMAWTVPAMAGGIHRVYAVIDPDDSLSEVHEENNKGFAEMTILSLTGVDENPATAVPRQFALFQNYPNPFNPSTVIRFEVPTRSKVILKVFDILGREVGTLLNADREAGTHNVWFDGSRLASGMYIYRLQAGAFSESRKLLLIR